MKIHMSILPLASSQFLRKAGLKSFTYMSDWKAEEQKKCPQNIKYYLCLHQCVTTATKT
jgi:hypothetical protein